MVEMKKKNVPKGGGSYFFSLGSPKVVARGEWRQNSIEDNSLGAGGEEKVVAREGGGGLAGGMDMLGVGGA